MFALYKGSVNKSFKIVTIFLFLWIYLQWDISFNHNDKFSYALKLGISTLEEYCKHYNYLKVIRGHRWALLPRTRSGDVLEGTEDLGRYRWCGGNGIALKRKINIT